MSSKLQSDIRYLVSFAPSGDCLQGEGLVWLVEVVECLLVAPWVQLSISAGSGWPHVMLKYQ